MPGRDAGCGASEGGEPPSGSPGCQPPPGTAPGPPPPPGAALSTSSRLGGSARVTHAQRPPARLLPLPPPAPLPRRRARSVPPSPGGFQPNFARWVRRREAGTQRHLPAPGLHCSRRLRRRPLSMPGARWRGARAAGGQGARVPGGWLGSGRRSPGCPWVQTGWEIEPWGGSGEATHSVPLELELSSAGRTPAF